MPPGQLGQLDVLFRVIEAFESLEVAYVIGGSFASSVYGLARATVDIDIVAMIRPEQAGALVEKLEPEFYADEVAIRRAAKAKRSFNVIHIETAYKVDIFVAESGGFDEQQLSRRQKLVIDRDRRRSAYLMTAEDIILAKLRWYRIGQEVSERQWRDVVSVVEVQGDQLDVSYLKEWARRLNLEDLLEQALREGAI